MLIKEVATERIQILSLETNVIYGRSGEGGGGLIGNLASFCQNAPINMQKHFLGGVIVSASSKLGKTASQHGLQKNLQKGENVKTELLMCKSIISHHFQNLTYYIPLSFVVIFK